MQTIIVLEKDASLAVLQDYIRQHKSVILVVNDKRITTELLDTGNSYTIGQGVC